MENKWKLLLGIIVGTMVLLIVGSHMYRQEVIICPKLFILAKFMFIILAKFIILLSRKFIRLAKFIILA